MRLEEASSSLLLIYSSVDKVVVAKDEPLLPVYEP